jgi:DNA-binding NarL/FixJ family response regulator
MTVRTLLLICHDAPMAMRWRQHLLAGGGFSVVGLTNEPSSARAMLQKHPVDAVVSDLSIMAGTTNGAIHALRGGPSEEKPAVVMMADRLEEPLLLSALRGGADSYHFGPLEGLPATVSATLRGESAIATPIAKQVLDLFDANQAGAGADPLGETPLQLTAQERDLLMRVATGSSLEDVASRSNTPPDALRKVVCGIYRKLRWILRANRLSLSLDDSGFGGDSGWGALKPSAGRNR